MRYCQKCKKVVATTISRKGHNTEVICNECGTVIEKRWSKRINA